MPTKPPSRQRPWLPKATERKAQEGRKERTNLYNLQLWVRTRKQQLMEFPLCAECEKKGKVTAATVCDHIIPYRLGKFDFFDRTNHQSLCKRCHDSKSIKERKKYKEEYEANTSPPRNAWHKQG